MLRGRALINAAIYLIRGADLLKGHFIGSGIGSLAGAAFMIRDGGLAGQDIAIYDALPLAGWSLDGAALDDGSYSLRGGRMLTIITNARGTFYRPFPPLSIRVRRSGTRGWRSIVNTKRIRTPDSSIATASRCMSRRCASPCTIGWN
ncbi:hypothetical protein ES707_10788 [subsurface metagenome]